MASEPTIRQMAEQLATKIATRAAEDRDFYAVDYLLGDGKCGAMTTDLEAFGQAVAARERERIERDLMECSVVPLHWREMLAAAIRSAEGREDVNERFYPQ